MMYLITCNSIACIILQYVYEQIVMDKYVYYSAI